MATTVTVLLSDVEEGVKTISAKVGLKTDDWSRALKAEDENSIQNYEKEGAYGLLEVMGRFCTSLANPTVSQAAYVYTLDMPSNWGSTAAKVQELISQYLINFVCSRWFGVVMPEKEKNYADNAARYEAIVFKELIMRAKPTRS